MQGAREHAVTLLAELAAGRWNVGLALQLGSAVMSDRIIRLATDVLALGPHTVERAIELAEALAPAPVITSAHSPTRESGKDRKPGY